MPERSMNHEIRQQSSVSAFKIEREVVLNIIGKPSEGVVKTSMNTVAWTESMAERTPVAC